MPAAMLALGLAGADALAAPRQIEVKLIAINDFHGNLLSPGRSAVNTLVPAEQRTPVGGAEALAAWVAQLKARNPLNAVVGAGDFIGASPLVSALFFDEPTVEALNHVGVEFTSVGNHEFDKGPVELQRLQHGGCKLNHGEPDPNSCKGLGSRRPGSFDGAHFKWLAANVVDRASGRPLLAPYAIKSFRGVPVAFIGMTLRGTAGIVAPSQVAGLEFRDEADTVNALVPRLRRQGVRAIVVLVHQGGTQTAPSVVDINGCDGNLKNEDGSDSEIARIVARLDDAVDLVISGHTHAAYNCSANTVDTRSVDGHVLRSLRPTGLANKAGRLVPVTSANAYGRLLTDIDLTLDARSHRVLAVSPVNRLVDAADPLVGAATAADPTLHDIVQGYVRLAAPVAEAVVGSIAAALPAVADEAGDMPAGRLVADAQLRATQAGDRGGAQIAFTNDGGVRAPGFVSATGHYPYEVTRGNAFAVQPFGNSLSTMTLTSLQLKRLLEQQFPGCGGQTVQGIMHVSNGFRYAWSASAPACARVVDVSWTPTDLASTPPAVTGAAVRIVAAGQVLEPTRTWRVTVNNFMAAGGGGLSTLKSGQDASGGQQDIDALTDYLAAYRAPAAPYDPQAPALGTPRITRVP